MILYLCNEQAGFSPHAHLISAWNARPELGLFTDRLFCQRTGETVPLTLEEHPPRIREVLAIKVGTITKTITTRSRPESTW